MFNHPENTFEIAFEVHFISWKNPLAPHAFFFFFELGNMVRKSAQVSNCNKHNDFISDANSSFFGFIDPWRK